MSSRRVVCPALFLLAATACADSTPANRADTGVGLDGGADLGVDLGLDAGDPSDAAADLGLDLGSPDAGASICGDQIREGAEACDDGNTVSGDACNADCTLPPVCGDGVREGDELCDDGNNVSGDGCSGTCLTEGCGNGRLDPREVCDGTPGCASDCTQVASCGDGTLDAGEACDDGNLTPFDGCSQSCLRDRAMVVSTLRISDQGACDLNGDGYLDSLLGAALSSSLSLLQPQIDSIVRTSPFFVFTMMGFEDDTLTLDDPDVRLGWVRGDDANGAGANFDGNGLVRVTPGSVLGGLPVQSFGGTYVGGRLDVGPEDISVPVFAGINLGVKRAHIVDTALTVSGSPARASIGTLAGTICGSVEVRPVAQIPNVISFFGVPGIPTNSCDPTRVPSNEVTLADLIVGGALFNGGIPVVEPAQPDVDRDGDGIESYEVVTGTGCQPVIVACIDGDGTRIDGRYCIHDERMADAWSITLKFTAPTVGLVP